MAPKYTEVVIKMDGVQYTENEALTLVASLAERSDLNHHGIEVIGSKKPAVPPSEPRTLPADEEEEEETPKSVVRQKKKTTRKKTSGRKEAIASRKKTTARRRKK